jgi:hypothetical protein
MGISKSTFIYWLLRTSRNKKERFIRNIREFEEEVKRRWLRLQHNNR